MKKPDLDIGSLGLLPFNVNMVTRKDLQEVQDEHADVRPPRLTKSREVPSLWVTPEKKI